MSVLRWILTILFIIDSIALTVLVLLQESKQGGLRALGGASSADTYWGKNKGRSMEGNLVRITRYLTIVFLVLAAVLNVNKF